MSTEAALNLVDQTISELDNATSTNRSTGYWTQNPNTTGRSNHRVVVIDRLNEIRTLLVGNDDD